MVYRLGRLLQLVGLILLPVAIAGNLSPEHTLDLRESLTVSFIGMGIFYVGYLVQRAGQPR